MEGIILTINSLKYFVQARIISHVFDTKGAEKTMNFVSTTNSKYGSPLVNNGVRGVYFNDLNKVAFIDDLRMYSDLDHVTRFIGQSKQCCPFKALGEANVQDDYFIDDLLELSGNKSNSLDLNNIGKIIVKTDKSIEIDQEIEIYEDDANIFELNDKKLCIMHMVENGLVNDNTAQKYKKFLKKLIYSEFKKIPNKKMNEEKSFTWHHFRHDKRELICDHLNFTHCCYKVRKYKSTTQDDYKAASDYYNKKNNNDIGSGDEIDDDDISDNDQVEANYADNFYKGIKKGDSFFHKLPYSNIETDFSWDVMHIIKNISVHLIDLISGNRLKDKVNVRNHCKRTGCHKQYYETGNQPWAINTSNQDKIDVFISSIRIPIGYSDKFQLRTIFRKSSFINTNGHLTIIRSLLDLIGFIGKLPYVYREFLSMLQSDFCEILRPKFNAQYDFHLLFKLINETAICRAGLFPASEIYFEWLQILDIPHALKTIGPVRCYWSFTGERFNNEVLQYTRVGGYNSDLTTIIANSSIADEKLRLVNAFIFCLINNISINVFST